MESSETPKARFQFPFIHDNPDGWGPCEVPEQFKDTPYQPFSKSDRLGKVAFEALELELFGCVSLCQRSVFLAFV